MTIREMVAEIQLEVRDTDLLPDRARVLLTKLTALVGNCNTEIRRADAAYAEVLMQCLDTEGKANRAKIRAELTPEFAAKREARDTKELVEQMIGSLKYMLRSLSEEMRLAR